MKRTILILQILFFLFNTVSVSATDYYVNSKTGNNKNNGNSPATAWKSLKKVNTKNFKPGDKILLATGQVFFGTIQWKNQYGNKSKPIVISSYMVDHSNAKPIINAKNHLNGIKLENCSFITIDGLSLKADGGNNNPKKGMRCGILYTANEAGSFNNITIENCTIKDVFFENANFQRGKDEVKTANGTQSYGWGIRFLLPKKSSLKHVLIQSNEIENVSHTGIKINGRIDDLNILDNNVFKTGGPGMQFSHVSNAQIKGNDINFSGSKDDSRKWGRGSGMWTWGCENFIIEHNSFRNANGPADSAGCHIDFNCKNIIVQYNVSENNAGGFAEILGNNWNCSYRYNVSINDGHRIKKKGVAFQEGKIFWLSGFVGKDRKRHGPYNSYFYNNTIYVKSELLAKMAVSKVAEGVLIANNIFYIEGDSKAVLGDQYKPQEAGEAEIPNQVFKNNLYLKANNWPKKVLIQDQAPVYGNPEFTHAGGKEIIDYTPKNIQLIKNKGIVITKIPNDKNGLFTGLNISKDILGNPIKGLPDMGAIELE